MTEHLQECWATYPSDPPAWCICDELRAYEQRISGEWETFSRDHFEAGYAAAMNDAVKRVEDYLQHDVADGWMPRSKAEGIIKKVGGGRFNG